MARTPGAAGRWMVYPDTSVSASGQEPAGLVVVGVYPDGSLVRAPGGGAAHWVDVPVGMSWPLALRAAMGHSAPLLRSAHPVAVARPADGGPPWWVVWGGVHHRQDRLPLANGADLAPVDAAIVALVLADHRAGVPAERWYRDNTTYLGTTYLASDTEFGQSGKSGDAEDWELGRRVVANAVHRGGAFLDIGCANGLLLASLLAWTGERGHRLVPFGIDIVPELVELARARLPEHRANLWCGNAATWTPPRRFDFVHTLLEYVPPHDRRAYVHRLVELFVAAGGRLVVSDYGRDPDQPSVADLLRGWGLSVDGVAEQPRGPDRRPVVVTWLDRASG